MQARSPWLDAARDGKDASVDVPTPRPSTGDRRAIELLDALILVMLVVPFFL